MEGIPVDFAPREPTTQEEWEGFYEDLVRDFMVQNYGGIVSQVDITGFAVKYLHLHIVSAAFAEQYENLTSFLADDTSVIMIQQNGKLLRRVYPPGTIAVNRSLCQRGRDDDVAYCQFRFAVAVECAKWICRGFRKLGIAQAKQGASRLLMPRFLVMSLLDKYFGGKKVPIYDNLLYSSKPGVHAMAVSLGVNYSPMFYRIQALNLLEHHSADELVNDLLNFMQESLKRSMEEPIQEGSDENAKDWLQQLPSDSVHSQQTPSQVCQPPVQESQIESAKVSFGRRRTARRLR